MHSKHPLSWETPEEYTRMYREMLFIRHFEEKCNQIFRMGKAGGYLHVYIGMEALATGWLSAIRKGHDYVITAYRDHAHALCLGSDPVAVMAEIMGRKGGLSDGKGGSMHLYDIQKGFYGGWGIVGGNIPLGGGLAFASQYRKEDKVVLNYLGDGASNAGVFFETLNMAGLWGLPCIFIIENNEFAMGTRLKYHAADPELHKRGYPFGIKHERIDGMDVLQVRRDAERIIEEVRKEQKPYVVEMMTYRFSGHGAADVEQSFYRTKEEVLHAEERDPLSIFGTFLKTKNILTESQMNEMDQQTRKEVEEVFAKADQLPFLEPEAVYTHVYTDMEPEKGH